jgi:hypothetical protein
MNPLPLVLGALAALAVSPPENEAARHGDCNRDVHADLVTIQDRLDSGRLDAARAYADDLLACPEGQQSPTVHLAVAEIEQRLGRLNAAFDALQRAAGVATADQRPAVAAATVSFRSRWVAVDLFPSSTLPSDPMLVHTGLVTDDATALCLDELAAAVRDARPETLPRTLWIVPGDYVQGPLNLRLPPGSQYTLKVATDAAQGAP